MTTLTTHDLSILQKIADPESGPSAPLLLDSSQPKDPHYPDPSIYTTITQLERSIISSIQKAELQAAGLQPPSSSDPSLDIIQIYQEAITQLTSLISKYPLYASARNNRAQALRRLYGDLILIKNPPSTSTALLPSSTPSSSISEPTLLSTATLILTDLSTAITLLTPSSPYTPLSPTAAKTLSQAYTQRGALYHITSKAYSQTGTKLRIEEGMREAKWSIVEFEEHASRDFMRGGRLGNEVAKQMAVVANPTAKLCGDMVREAMRKEFEGMGS